VKVIGPQLYVFLLSVGLACSALAQTAPVPVVGCKSDGQIGPKPAPEISTGPVLPITAASRLAWYDSGDLSVLAPRGWKCLGLYGSNGSILLVVPGVRKSPLGLDQRINGQGIQLSLAYGDTSGRFEAAKIAAQLFPNRRAFVDEVANEGLLPSEAFRKTPFPDDRIHHLGLDQASFETPANKDGLGTMSRLVKSGDPISGVAKIDVDNNVTLLVVRLDSALRDLSPTILTTVSPR
jgi:hypothetical protein